jgi:hypothetical protein
LLSDLRLPWSDGLLKQYKLISPEADAMQVMRVMQRLINLPVIAERRAFGMSLQGILRAMSPRSLALLRTRLKKR